ncbi:MAG: hypothetical protein P3W87_008730 [Gammaproteobacteria bacterium]|nr:hypothetical protein [Gammaproteobacteria bacterium]
MLPLVWVALRAYQRDAYTLLAAVVLLASALNAERRRAMQALAELNAHLEERVAERT